MSALVIGIYFFSPNKIVSYIDEFLDRFNMCGCNGIGTPMLEADRDKIVSTHTELLDANKKRFQQAFGCLLYLMHRTRPNLSFASLNIAQSLRNTIWMPSRECFNICRPPVRPL